MRVKPVLAGVLLIGATAGTHAFLSGPKVQPQAAPPRRALADETVVSARGRVEPVSEEIQISSQLAGRLKSVYVKEGQNVKAGQAIAEIENDEYRARVTSAEARLAEREAVLRRVANGARGQEKLEALAGVKEAEAVMENARTEAERRKQLLERGAISREEADRATEKYNVARARYDAADQHYRFVAAEPREEDYTKALAEVNLARGDLEECRAMLDKTLIRSPIHGTVLRKHRNSGETVQSQPIVTLGDMSHLRVRAEVDESDIAALATGQQAYVIADAYGTTKFRGKVARIGSALGKKTVLSDDPSDRLDRKVLETFIDLDPGTTLPSGLRVDAFIQTGAHSDERH